MPLLILIMVELPLAHPLKVFVPLAGIFLLAMEERWQILIFKMGGQELTVILVLLLLVTSSAPGIILKEFIPATAVIVVH
jgi:hypothetical protein